MNRLTIALLLGSLAVSIGCKKPPPPAAPVAAGPKARQTAQSVGGQLKRGARLERAA
jgi:hypothetical protein